MVVVLPPSSLERFPPLPELTVFLDLSHYHPWIPSSSGPRKISRC